MAVMSNHGSKWTSEHVDFLRKNCSALNSRKLAAALGRTQGAVLRFMEKHDIPRSPVRGKPWTTEEIFTLEAELEHKTAAQVAKILSRSIHSVRAKMVELGLKQLSDSFSLKGAAAYTGYDVRQLLRARQALNQKWGKVYNKGRFQFVITSNKLDKLCNYLKTEKKQLTPPEIRFWRQVVKTEDCWIWRGSEFFAVAEDRGQFKRPGTMAYWEYRPAAYAWKLIKGDSDGRRIFRRCNQHLPGRCINPEHHFLSEKPKNTLDNEHCQSYSAGHRRTKNVGSGDRIRATASAKALDTSP